LSATIVKIDRISYPRAARHGPLALATAHDESPSRESGSARVRSIPLGVELQSSLNRPTAGGEIARCSAKKCYE